MYLSRYSIETVVEDKVKFKMRKAEIPMILPLLKNLKQQFEARLFCTFQRYPLRA